MIVKTCFKCGAEKPLEDFYPHSQMKDGHLNKCKTCTKKDVSVHRAANLKKIQKYDRIRGRTEKRKANVRAYSKTHGETIRSCSRMYTKKYPWKKKATSAVNNAIRDGRLVRGPCEKCGAAKAEAHHDDYSKPLEVRWLCDAHHKEHHRNLRDKLREQVIP